MLPRPLIIDVLWHTEETGELDKIGIEYDVSKLIRKKCAFYVINAITPTTEFQPPYEYCKILSNGDQFVIPMRMDEVLKLIEKL